MTVVGVALANAPVVPALSSFAQQTGVSGNGVPVDEAVLYHSLANVIVIDVTAEPEMTLMSLSSPPSIVQFVVQVGVVPPEFQWPYWSKITDVEAVVEPREKELLRSVVVAVVELNKVLSASVVVVEVKVRLALPDTVVPVEA